MLDEFFEASLPSPPPHPEALPNPLSRETMISIHFLAVSAIVAFVGLVSVTCNNKYRAACQGVEGAISTASDVYYSGEYGDHRIGRRTHA